MSRGETDNRAPQRSRYHPGMNRVLATFLPGICIAGSLACFSPAQVADLTAAERELHIVFDRPAGAPIAEEQQKKLADFLRRHEGQDLGRFGYARALDFYFRRDALGGSAALDTFFEKNDRIAHEEHATLAGRIYLMAMREASQQPNVDAAKLHRWAERAVAMYPDLPAAARLAASVQPGLAEGAAFRMALVRGLQRSSSSDPDKDRFLSILYAAASPNQPGAATPAMDVVTPSPLAIHSAPTIPRAAREPVTGAALDTLKVGAAPPVLPVEHALNAKPDFRLADLRGKVVVLDFFATWCPPCRTGIAELLKLQQQHQESVRAVGVTRFYGRGMDFAKGDKTPHGGKSVHGLARDDEAALNTRFASAFGIAYPILFTTEKAMKEAYGVGEIPTTVVIGKDGSVLARIVGNGDEERQRVRDLIDQALR